MHELVRGDVRIRRFARFAVVLVRGVGSVLQAEITASHHTAMLLAIRLDVEQETCVTDANCTRSEHVSEHEVGTGSASLPRVEQTPTRC